LQNGRPTIDPTEQNAALYPMNEHAGNVARSNVTTGLDLHIPERYSVVDQIFLEPIWKEFSMTRNYWRAAVKNIVGLIPLGSCFYAFLLRFHRFRHAAAITVALGLTVSLTIEITQGFLPTRDSGTSDIFTNTLGAYCGVILYRWSRRFVLVQRLLRQ
jgi:glycopeptide antibiotics resistance protein